MVIFKNHKNLSIGKLIIRCKNIKRKVSLLADMVEGKIRIYFWVKELDTEELKYQEWEMDIYPFNDKRKYWMLPMIAYKILSEEEFEKLKDEKGFRPNGNYSVKKIKQWEIVKII